MQRTTWVRKKCAILPSTGIGDALLMMVASHTLFKQGYEVTTFHPKLPELQAWFPGHHLKPSYALKELQDYDLVIAQNNNSETIQTLLSNRPHLKRLSLFYPTYKQDKHGPLSPDDRPFNTQKNMVENIATATASLIDHPSPSPNNGLIPLPGITHRLHPKRIIIQPLSTDPTRTWLPRRFLSLAKKLKKKGFHPVFTLTESQQNIPFWSTSDIEAPHFKTLSDLTAYTYESGFVIGNDSLLPHLASNLNIPHLVIGHRADHMRLWRPGWLQGNLLLPPSWAPNLKFCRLRDTHWRHWITVKAVLRSFHDLLSRS